MSDPASYPVELPPGCPPASAVAAGGAFYRLVGRSLALGEAPGANDWILPHKKRKGECAGQTQVCECHAHSLIADLDHVRLAWKLVPWVRKKAVARVDLDGSMGRILQWPTDVFPSHYEWWPTPATLVPRCEVVEGAPA